METTEKRRCAICGAIIDDCNTTGIGFGCRHNVLEPAQRETFFRLFGLEIWEQKCMIIRNKFIELYSCVKFRNAFKKSFFESMKNASRISKKQLEVMMQMIEEKDVRCTSLLRSINENISKRIDQMPVSLNAEQMALYNDILQKHKIAYLSGKKINK